MKIKVKSIVNDLDTPHFLLKATMCYDLKSLEWDSKTTLVLSNTRELDRVPKTK